MIDGAPLRVHREIDSNPLHRGAGTRARTALSVLSFTVACHGSLQSPAGVDRPVDSSTNGARSESAQREATFDQRVDVGGLHLHIHCEGAGLPLVVFDSGLGQGEEAWS